MHACVHPLQGGAYLEASKAAVKVEGHQKAVTTLLVANAYEQDDLVGCRRQLDKCLPEDPDTMVNAGCVLFKEGKYEPARQKFNDAVSALGYQPELLYNIALCFYKTKQFSPALKHLAEIIEKGVREHPELSIGRCGGQLRARQEDPPVSWPAGRRPVWEGGRPEGGDGMADGFVCAFKGQAVGLKGAVVCEYVCVCGGGGFRQGVSERVGTCIQTHQT